MRVVLGIFALGLFVTAQSLATEPSHTRRVKGTVTHVDRATGRVSVRADGQDVDVQYPRAKARRMKRGDPVTVLVVVHAVNPPRKPALVGDPGPPAKEVPPPAGYPVGPGMGPIGAGSPNAGPGSPVGADGAR